MKKIIPDLMIINKMIILNESIMEDDADLDYFMGKIIEDFRFIVELLEQLQNSYHRTQNNNEFENVQKIFGSTIKRIHRIIEKLKDQCSNSPDKILQINSIYNQSMKISRQFKNPELLSSEFKHFVNNDEYQLLLKDLDLK